MQFPAAVTVDTSADLIIAARGDCIGLVITNTGSVTVYVGPDNTVSTSKYTFQIAPGGDRTMTEPECRKAWYGITSSSSTTVSVTQTLTSDRGA